MKNKIKVGQTVRSNYRSKWKGEVTDVTTRPNTTPLLTVLVTHDSHGNLQRKPFKTSIDSSICTVLSDQAE
jgi:hypothetical protein